VADGAHQADDLEDTRRMIWRINTVRDVTVVIESSIRMLLRTSRMTWMRGAFTSALLKAK